MTVGDIVRVKYTGESVCIIEENTPGFFSVRRARQTRDGIQYVSSNFCSAELEPVMDNIDREFSEAMYRHTLMSKQTQATVEVPEVLGPVQ